MTFRPPFLTLVCTLSLLAQACLLSQTPPAEPPEAVTANQLTADFVTQHDEGIKRLGTVYAARLEPERQRLTQAGDTAAATSVADLITQLQNARAEVPIEAKNLPPAADAILKEHNLKQKFAVASLAQMYLAKFDTLKARLLKAGDTEGAAQAERARADVESIAKPPPPSSVRELPPVPRPPGADGEIVVEAYIDGNSYLHVTQAGLYWETRGNVAKPGLHNGANLPCYVNGVAWQPKWKLPEPRGADTSEVFPFPATSPPDGLTVERVSVSKERFGLQEEKRTPVTGKVQGDQFIVEIADPDSGARWQKIRIAAKGK